MPTNLVEVKKTFEDRYTEQLYKLFSTYGDVKIVVNVLPDLSVRKTTDLIVDPKNKVVAPEMEQSREDNQRDGIGPGGEPGLKSNETVALTDAGSAGRGGGSNSTESNVRNKVVIGEQHREAILPAGIEIKQLTATMIFPRSYFLALFRRNAKDDKAEPDDAALQPLIDQQLKSMVASAKTAIGATSDDQIRADWYDDTLTIPGAELIMAKAGLGGAGGGGGAAGLVPVVIQYAKQGVLAIVALSVLGMMLMMVRRAVPAGVSEEGADSVLGAFAGVGAAARGKKKGSSVEQLDAVEDVFGEANQGEAVLTGIELDDETLASRKMVDEVSSMIKENPENAAALVKRWMTKNN
jgi:flagellar biosynthesis/type III secretory pathway M-ring protein FliF/YscJ